jgi:hypothetical protein
MRNATWLVARTAATITSHLLLVSASFARPVHKQSLIDYFESVAFLLQQMQRYSESQRKVPATANDSRSPAAPPALRARESLVHVLLNHYDFVTLR